MKRDLDVIRSILLKVEEVCDSRVALKSEEIEIAGADANQVGYHCVLLMDDDYIEGIDSRSMGSGYSVIVRRMTAAGHDYLDAVRADTVWIKVKAKLAETGVSIPLDAVKAVAVGIATKMVLG